MLVAGGYHASSEGAFRSLVNQKCASNLRLVLLARYSPGPKATWYDLLWSVAKNAGFVSGFLPGIFSGGGAKSIVMQVSFVVLIFLLFSNQISGGAKSPRGVTASGGAPCPPWKKASVL